MGAGKSTLECGLPEQPFRALHQPVHPWMDHFAKTVLRTLVAADGIEGMGGRRVVLEAIGEPDAVVGRHGMDPKANGVDSPCLFLVKPGPHSDLQLRSMATKNCNIPFSV